MIPKRIVRRGLIKIDHAETKRFLKSVQNTAKRTIGTVSPKNEGQFNKAADALASKKHKVKEIHKSSTKKVLRADKALHNDEMRTIGKNIKGNYLKNPSARKDIDLYESRSRNWKERKINEVGSRNKQINKQAHDNLMRSTGSSKLADPNSDRGEKALRRARKWRLR